jgi:hypothetical protein
MNALANFKTDGDLPSTELACLREGLTVIESRRVRNEKIQAYYDGVARIRDLGIAIPPHLRNIETVVGWPAKTVDVRESRFDLEEFVGQNGETSPMGVDEMWAENHMGLEQSFAHTAALMHGVVFLTATAGDVHAGEPQVLYSIHEATNATIGWNPRTRRPDWAVVVVDRKNDASPQTVILYMPCEIITLRHVRHVWHVDRVRNPVSRVPVTMLTRRPRVGRRFGMPVITRAVISLTDSAVRTLLRSEVSAEFFSVPQRYALGVDSDAFSTTGWEAVIGKFLAISRDDDGDVPTMGQFPQVSIQGHTEQLRSLAMMFSGETSIPISYLGVIQDNPSSADAIRVGETSLIEDVERDQNSFGHGWVELNTLGVMIRDRLTEPPAELRRVRPRWRDAATPTRSAQTQNVVQLVSAGVLRPDSQVTYEQLGFDQITCDRLKAETQRSQVSALISRLPVAASEARNNAAVDEAITRRVD